MTRSDVIHLIGLPGVGKLTVAQALAATTGDDAPERIVLVDNHLISNGILRVVTLDERGRVPDRAWDLVAEVRQRVLTAIVELSPPRWSFVFTNVIMEGDLRKGETVDVLRELAAARGGRYVPIVLACGPDEHRRRIAAPGRAERQKWTDPDAVAALVADQPLAPPDDETRLDLDITERPPQHAAQAILAHLASLT